MNFTMSCKQCSHMVGLLKFHDTLMELGNAILGSRPRPRTIRYDTLLIIIVQNQIKMEICPLLRLSLCQKHRGIHYVVVVNMSDWNLRARGVAVSKPAFCTIGIESQTEDDLPL